MISPSLDLEPLFTPMTINGLELRNRFVMPAMQRQWCAKGRPQSKLTDYYCRRAEGGVGLIITESCAVDHVSSTQNDVFARMNDETADAWAACAAAVRNAGAPMLMQLWHEGALRSEGGAGRYATYPTLSPSGLIGPGKPRGKSASAADLDEIEAGFVRSARLARQAGFDGVELHAAHGFLLDQFLWHETNRRSDAYGGADIEARARFPARLVSAIRATVGPDFIISLRFSQWKEVDYGAKIVAEPSELRRLLAVMRAAGVDMFHASTRRFWVPEWPNSGLGLAGWAKASTDAPVIAVGSVGLDIDVMSSVMGEQAQFTGVEGLSELTGRFTGGEFDMVAIGRSLIGDPDWVNKVRAGDFDDIRMFTKRDLIGDLELADFNPDADHTR